MPYRLATPDTDASGHSASSTMRRLPAAGQQGKAGKGRGRPQVGARDRMEGTNAAVRAFPDAHQEGQAIDDRGHRHRP